MLSMRSEEVQRLHPAEAIANGVAAKIVENQCHDRAVTGYEFAGIRRNPNLPWFLQEKLGICSGLLLEPLHIMGSHLSLGAETRDNTAVDTAKFVFGKRT